MGATPQKLTEKASFSLVGLLESLAALECDWEEDGGKIRIIDPMGNLTRELKDAVADHKPALLLLAHCRVEYLRLWDYCRRLHEADPPRGTREQAIQYLTRQVDRFAEACQDAHGYADPADDFIAPAAVDILREEIRLIPADIERDR